MYLYLQSINKKSESMRDYRRYLSSDPIPADALEVQVELEELVDAQKEEIKRATASATAPQQQHGGSYHHHRSASGNQFSSSGSSNSSSSSHYTRPSTGKQSPYAEENFYDKFDSYKVRLVMHLQAA